MLEDHIRARQHIKTGRHHGRRMNQGGDRRRPGHGIRQPDVERELRRLATGANHQPEGNPGHQPPVTQRLDRIIDCLGNDRVVLRAAEGRNHCKNREHETEIPDAVRNESFA